jgi:hypothetical protein
MREDYSTNTEADAARYEDMRAETDAAADRPTLAELQRDDADHASGEYCIEWVGVDLEPDGPDKVWACVECGRTHRQGDAS